jgi:hypothetical protein
LLNRIDLLEAMMLRIHGLAETVLSAHDKAMLSAYKNMICRLPAKGIGTMEFNMTPERREAVKLAGEAAMEAFLAGSQLPVSAQSAPATP